MKYQRTVREESLYKYQNEITNQVVQGNMDFSALNSEIDDKLSSFSDGFNSERVNKMRDAARSRGISQGFVNSDTLKAKQALKEYLTTDDAKTNLSSREYSSFSKYANDQLKLSKSNKIKLSPVKTALTNLGKYNNLQDLRGTLVESDSRLAPLANEIEKKWFNKIESNEEFTNEDIAEIEALVPQEHGQQLKSNINGALEKFNKALRE